MKIDVPEALAGERVDRAVAFLTGLSRSDVTAMVGEGAVRIGGKPVRTRSQRVGAGDVLEVDVPEQLLAVPLAGDAAVPFDLVYADDHVAVIDKPAGVVVHPGAGVRSATLVHGLLARFPEMAAGHWPDPDRPGIVHRLDKDTSGLLVVGRTVDAAAHLMAQLKARAVERSYIALVNGEMANDAGTIDAPVGRSSRDRTRMAVAAGGREARTHYVVMERFAGPHPLTLVTCQLDTGRTHQIRVHMAAIGHSVVGDRRYRGAAASGLQRPFLHAARLAFDHPVSGDRVAHTSELPAELDAVRTAARAAR